MANSYFLQATEAHNVRRRKWRTALFVCEGLWHCAWYLDVLPVTLVTNLQDPVEDVVQKLEEKPVPGFVKVIGYTKLSKEYKQYSARRELLKSYDAFFVDDRILPMMPRVLGKTFFARKRQPVPVAMSGSRSLTNALLRARDSTPLYLGAGLCVAIKVGHTGMTPAQVAGNIMSVLPQVIEHMPRKWRNIASVHVKLPESAALPLFMALAHDEVAAAVAAGVKAPVGGGAAVHGASGAGGDEETDPVVSKIQWDEGATPAKGGAPKTPAASTGKRGAKRARSTAKPEQDAGQVVGGASATKRPATGGKRFFDSAKKTPGRKARGSQ
jgi:hypothetical protein